MFRIAGVSSHLLRACLISMNSNASVEAHSPFWHNCASLYVRTFVGRVSVQLEDDWSGRRGSEEFFPLNAVKVFVPILDLVLFLKNGVRLERLGLRVPFLRACLGISHYIDRNLRLHLVFVCNRTLSNIQACPHQRGLSSILSPC
jgi:hypothetical protein